MKRRIDLFFYGMAMLVISGCNLFEPSIVDGGPCSYKDTKLVARVVAVETYDSIHYDVLFKLDSNALIPSPNDTIAYSRETHDYFEKAALDSAGIKIGNRYTYLVRDIIEGHCSPHITRLILMPLK
jgi:hypothetical protein